MQTYSHYILQSLPIFCAFSLDLFFQCSTLQHCLVFLPESASWFDDELWTGRFLLLILNVFHKVWTGFSSPAWTPQTVLCCMLEALVPNMQELVKKCPRPESAVACVSRRCDSGSNALCCCQLTRGVAL